MSAPSGMAPRGRGGRSRPPAPGSTASPVGLLGPFAPFRTAEWTAFVEQRQARLAESQLPWVQARKRARTLRNAERVLAVCLVLVYPALFGWLPLWVRGLCCSIALSGVLGYWLVRAWMWGKR